MMKVIDIKRYLEVKNISLKNLTLKMKNFKVNESEVMNKIIKIIGNNTICLKMVNSYIGNLDSYMSAISSKKGKNYFLSEKQYIKYFSYNKKNLEFKIAAENLELLSEINRYKQPKLLSIKLYNEKDYTYLFKYIDIIRNISNQQVILTDCSKKGTLNIYDYEAYINKKLVLFQSELVKNSLGLDKLPTYKVNQMLYNIKIDGSKVNNECTYVLQGKEEELFIKDMKEIAKYINIGVISFKNVVFCDKYEIKEVLNEVHKKAHLQEEVIKNVSEFTVVKRRNFIDVIKEKIFKIFKINLGFNKNQKAFPIYSENNKM